MFIKKMAKKSKPPTRKSQRSKLYKPSDPFWAAIIQRAKMSSGSELGRLIDLAPAVMSRARRSSNPLLDVPRLKRERLLAELAKTFEHPDTMRDWLEHIGWPDLAEWHAWLERHFRQREKLPFLRQLTADYESRPALETEILKHLLPGNKLYQQRPIAESGVLVTGVRGQGKTALVLGALRACPQLDEEFPDGVYFLDCHQQTAEQSLEMFAITLKPDLANLASEKQFANVQQLANGKALLVVLDDVEEFRTIQKFFAALKSCVTSRLLITTHQRFSTPDLNDVRLHRLEVPDLTAIEGARLAERALHQPLLASEQTVFERLLTRIGGHPLALKILIGLKDDTQCTWSRVLQTVEESPLGALTNQDVAGKEGSVRLCFDLVYQRLADRQPRAAAVFRALGVFAGMRGFVEQLVSVANLAAEMESTLQYLVRYRLLTLEMAPFDSKRIWHMHPLLHDYAVMKLHEQPAEENEVQARYLHSMAEATKHLRLTYEQQPTTYPQLIVVRDDLAHAIRLAAQLDDLVMVADLIDLGAELLIKVGWAEPLAALLADLNINWRTAPEILQARIAAIWGQIELARQHPAQAYTHFEQALQFELPPSMSIELLLAASRIQVRLEQLTAAEELVARANTWAALNRPHTPLNVWANVYEMQAELAHIAGDSQQALGYFARAEESYEAAGWKLSVARMQLEQAACLIQLHQPAKALQLLDQARAFFNVQTWPLIYLEGLLENYCFAFLQQSNYEAVQAELDRWEQLLGDFTTMDLTPNHAKLWQWRGALAERQRHYALALSQYQKSLTLWQQVPASASHQQLIQERMAAVQLRLSEEPHAEDASA